MFIKYTPFAKIPATFNPCVNFLLLHCSDLNYTSQSVKQSKTSEDITAAQAPYSVKKECIHSKTLVSYLC